MTAASPAAPPPVADPGMNSHASAHNNMNLPRFHPIAINPNGTAPTSGPPSYHRPYGAPILDHTASHHAPTGPLPPPLPPAPAPHQLQYQHQPPQHQGPVPPSQQQQQQQQQQQPHQHTPQSGPPSRPPSHPPLLPIPVTSQLDQIEVRLRQIEHEEAGRSAARAHMLAMRRREDEEFRMVTERAEAEEEDLRRRRKRLKRESMGLTIDGQIESPPAPASRRLSETSAATTLAFFKQQSPPEPRPPELRAPPPPPPPPHHHHHQPAIIQQPTPMMAATTIMTNGHGTGSFRKKQKYTIKNAEAWGERHGRPATYDAAGRALWKRPSDGQLVYLDCPAPDCGKSDFVTLHGFMCHLTKKHKDRSMGSQSRALDLCGTVYDPNAPRPQRPSLKGGSTVNSRAGSVHTEADVEMEDEDAYSSSASDIHDGRHNNNSNIRQDGVVKKEDTSSPVVTTATAASATPTATSTVTNGSNESTSSNKASIASMIDNNVAPDDRWVAKKSSTPVEDGTKSTTSTENHVAVSTKEEAAAAAVLAGQSSPSANEVQI